MTHRGEWERAGQNRKRKQNCFGKILATLPSRNLGSNRCILPYVARSPLIASPAYFRRAAVVRRSRCGKQTDKDDDGRSLRAWRRFFRDKGMTIGNVQQPLALSPDANTQSKHTKSRADFWRLRCRLSNANIPLQIGTQTSRKPTEGTQLKTSGRYSGISVGGFFVCVWVLRLPSSLNTGCVTYKRARPVCHPSLLQSHHFVRAFERW